MVESRYDLKTLCVEAEVTPRTVHYYIQAGLLRPTGMPGPGARYDQGHLSRLRLIKLLQKEHLPLAEIRKRLELLNDEEVEAVLSEYRPQNMSSRSTATDYIRSVLGGKRHEQPPRAVYAAEIAKPSALQTVQPGPDRSQWERIALATDVELHIRRPLSREQNRQVDRLILFARELFKEEMR
jgi:DNA-binding transcriptional MerR regulator